MFRQDFLIRMIQQLAEAILGLLRRGGQEAEDELEGLLTTHAGLSLALAERLNPDTLLGMLTTDQGLDLGRASALGLVLRAKAVLLARREQHAEAERVALLALEVLLATEAASHAQLASRPEPAVVRAIERLAPALEPVLTPSLRARLERRPGH